MLENKILENTQTEWLHNSYFSVARNRQRHRLRYVQLNQLATELIV